jgi:hypothetical protein
MMVRSEDGGRGSGVASSGGNGGSSQVWITVDGVTYSPEEYNKLVRHRELIQKLDRIIALLDR